MQLKTWVAGVAVLSMVGTAVVAIAQDATPTPATQPAEKHTAPVAAAHHMKIVMPFGINALTDLTDDQKAKITDLHEQELAAEKALKDKEQTDVMAILTDEQKAELKEIKDKADAEKKADAEARRAKMAEQKADELKAKAAGMPTTAPSTPAK